MDLYGGEVNFLAKKQYFINSKLGRGNFTVNGLKD